MAAASLLALIDDIATVLDDVAALTKVAARKTAGVLGDDLALNAQQVTGVRAQREIPVVWEVAKGSAKNKAILVPAALAISAVAPWAVLPLLMLGGAFLCYEGFEKVAHKLVHDPAEEKAHRAELAKALTNPEVDFRAIERKKIRGAIRTDFILSAEIIVITLGTVGDAALGTRIAVVVGIALLMTVGVYGLVAAIVKLDDLGLHLSRRDGAAAKTLGRWIVIGAPWLMKTLSVVGTAAMFLVGGGILVHGIGPLHHFVVAQAEAVAALAGGLAGALAEAGLNGLAGLAAGGVLVAAVTPLRRRWPKSAPASPGAADESD